MVSTWGAFWFGCLGGVGAGLTFFLLPEALRLYYLNRPPILTAGRVAGILAILAIFAGLGGLVALIPDHVTRGQAIAYGVAAEAVLKSIFASGREVVRPSDD
jgi:hypothetical protein